MGIDVKAERHMVADRRDVAAYAMDPRNDAVWVTGIVEAEMLSEPPLAKGSTVRRTATFLGRRIDYVMEVEELDPGSRIVMRSIEGPFPMRVTYSFEDDAGGTKATIRVEGGPGGVYRIGEPLISMAVRRSISKDLENLQRMTQSGDARP